MPTYNIIIVSICIFTMVVAIITIITCHILSLKEDKKNVMTTTRICEDCKINPVLCYPSGYECRRCKECATNVLTTSPHFKSLSESLLLEAATRMDYDPQFGDKKECVCGHIYYRHFDSYDDMEPVGCKYCPCRDFQEGNIEDYIHMKHENPDFDWPVCYGEHRDKKLKFTKDPEKVTCKGCKHVCKHKLSG